jgi:hypothetical protein
MGQGMTQISSVADGQLQGAEAGEEAGLADDATLSFSSWSLAW